MKAVVVGAGLAGCEAAWQLANGGVQVELIEMKPERRSPAHHSELFAELVCSNSLKAARLDSAAGLLKQELRLLGSLCMRAADNNPVAAGGALAVDRTLFSKEITERIYSHPNIRVVTKEQADIPDARPVVIATGPLTSDALAREILSLCGEEYLSFYDAAAPIVTAGSVDFDKAFFAARYEYDTDGGDYINCPMDKPEYERFYSALLAAERAPLKEFDQNPGVYEGCMPVEVLAARGPDTLRFGPMKPVGLRDPRTGHRPWAVVQLRKETAAGELYNLVGFQTNLKFAEQKRVFSLIPALHGAEFARYGVMHRNTFLCSPRLLKPDYSLIKDGGVFFAGQMTGVEGYMESASSGLVAGMNALRRLKRESPFIPEETTMIGALCHYISDRSVSDFQPMGANFGVLPPIEPKIKNKRERYAALSRRALSWYETMGITKP